MQVVISGYGRMGHMVEEVLREKGIPCAGISEDIASFDPAIAAQSVCIDFTFPSSFRENYPLLAGRFKAVVVGTTGWHDIAPEVIACFEKHGTPMIYASNFSIGVNVSFALSALAAEKLRGLGYKASIVETHHIHKLDAPSGTAVTMGKIVEGKFGDTVAIESRRIGEVPGIHELTFEGACDKITICHEAFSRKGLAEGAVRAAELTEGLSGVHEFKDLIL